MPPPLGQPPQGLLIVLHGWGANAQDVASLSAYLDLPEFQMLFPDAPFPYAFGPMGRVWYNFPPNYTFACDDSLGQQPELIESRQLLLDWLRSLESTTGIPLSRTILAGFSQGGAMTLEVGLQLPLAGLLVLSGYLHRPIEPCENPPSVLMVHGRQDMVVPLEAAHASRDRLRAAGVSVAYDELNGGHEISLRVLELVQIFTRKICQPADGTA